MSVNKYDSVNDKLIPIAGVGLKDNYIESYIVGETPFASDWLSLESSGDPLTPETKKFYLINTDGDFKNFLFIWDDTENLYAQSSGSNAGSGGHTILDALDTELTQRDTLKFGGDFDVSDDSTNEQTIVKPHELTTEEFNEIMGDLPHVSPNNSGNPVGTIISFFGDIAPKGYLACDGTEYNKSQYQALATHLASLTSASQYVVDSDDTKFKVPDLRGEFLRGTGTNSYENQGSGGDVGEHQDGTLHTNVWGNTSEVYYSQDHSGQEATFDSTNNQGALGYSSKSGDSATTNHPVYYTSRPTNTSVLYCIKY